MLRYLDLGNSTAQSPNENYSRELMELFTMGPDAFTEDDVRAGAKALSGWREPRTQAMIDADVKRQQMRTGQAPKTTPKADTVKTGVYEAQRGYRGAAFAFLGESRVWNTDAVLARASVVTEARQDANKLPSAANANNSQIDDVKSASTLTLLHESADDRRRSSILLSSPESQLKSLITEMVASIDKIGRREFL